MVRNLDKHLVDNLYVEAMVLADEARSFFDQRADEHRVLLDNRGRVDFACEALKATTRLMHVIAWLLHRRAMFAGDPGAGPNDSAARIGQAVAADWDICAGFDASVRRIIVASERLFERIAAIEAGWEAPRAVTPTSSRGSWPGRPSPRLVTAPSATCPVAP